MNLQAQRDISRKLKVFAHAADTGNVAFTCRYFGISRETYYQWKRAFAAHGEKGLINSKPCPENPKLRTPLTIEEKILYLRIKLGWTRQPWPIPHSSSLSHVTPDRIARAPKLARHLPNSSSSPHQYLDFHCFLLSQHNRQPKSHHIRPGGCFTPAQWVSITAALTASSATSQLPSQSNATPHATTMQPLSQKPASVLELARNRLRNNDATESQMTPQLTPSKQEEEVAHEKSGIDGAMEARRLKVLALLQSNPESARVVFADSDNHPNNIILTIALRDVATFEMLVDRAKFNPMEFLDLLGAQI